MSSLDWPHTAPDMGETHYRNLYKDRIDFRELGREDPALAAVLDGRGQIDFQDAGAVKQLTTALLRRDFGLTVDLPDDRLCPPVPSRHSYILWLKALLDSSSGSEDDSKDGAVAAAPLVGLDIGTGASCIYPLLGCVQRRQWRFVATDIDERSLAYALANVRRNDLQDRIRVLPARAPEDALIPEGADGCAKIPSSSPFSFSFTMTNPPFYGSADEMAASAKAKNRPPHAVCTGAPHEMVTAGGEVAFVSRLLTESIARHDAHRDAPGCWYTAMLGKLSSLAAVVEQLRARRIDNYAVAVFVQGRSSSSSSSSSKTRRWAIGWSFGGMRPSAEAVRGVGGGGSIGGSSSSSSSSDAIRHLLPPNTEADLWSIPAFSSAPPAGTSSSISQLAADLDVLMRGLELVSWTWDRQHLRGVGRARQNVWARAWRRRKLRQQMSNAAEAVADDSVPAWGECAFGFVLSIQVGLAETVVRCRWTEGHDEALFQSFCGFARRKLLGRIAAEGDEDAATTMRMSAGRAIT